MKVLRASLLVIALCGFTYAGNMECDRTGNNPNDKAGEMECDKTNSVDPVLTTAMLLLESMLPLF